MTQNRKLMEKEWNMHTATGEWKRATSNGDNLGEDAGSSESTNYFMAHLGVQGNGEA